MADNPTARLQRRFVKLFSDQGIHTFVHTAKPAAQEEEGVLCHYSVVKTDAESDAILDTLLIKVPFSRADPLAANVFVAEDPPLHMHVWQWYTY